MRVVLVVVPAAAVAVTLFAKLLLRIGDAKFAATKVCCRRLLTPFAFVIVRCGGGGGGGDGIGELLIRLLLRGRGAKSADVNIGVPD